MFVYVLLITVISFVPGDLDIHVQQKALNTFDTVIACDIELERITKEMELSYPGHTDYRLTCEKREKKQAIEGVF